MSNFKDWLAHPFSTEMDAWHWFYFYGLIIAIAVGWSLILNLIRDV